ncbi:uncharacterized protein LOC141652912 [Silene latifolia]|uniref:uncharacterized protein LOC141652912 n=1 Tax=Silene latifolia TaxID=37657 RepID=UPI003D783599
MLFDQTFITTMSTSSSSSYSSTSSTSPHLSSSDKKHWWLNTKKMVDRYVKEAKVMISTGEQTELNSALSQLDAALSLSPRHELALELRARSLLYLRRYKDVADMLQDYIPSYKMDDSSGSSSDNSSHSSSRERVKLLGSSSSNNSTEFDSPSCDYPSFKCFSVSDLKKRVLSGFHKNNDKEGQWRYLVLGQACCHLGLMEDAMVLLQHGKRLASAAFRRESICWSDDSFSFTVDSESTSSSESAVNHRQPLTEIESISHLIAHIKLLLRRRAAAMAALDAGLYTESIRHFSKILEGRRAAPQAFLAECYLHRSDAFKSAGRLVESIADLNRTLALDPSSTTALQARAGLFEMIGCITDAVHDLEHVKLLYNSILRDRTPAAPAWKPKSVSYREIPGRLVTLGSKMNQLKQRIAMGETGNNVDYYGLIGLKRGCSRSELDRAHLLLALKHKPEKSISFIDRCEFSDEKDYDSVKDRARMSAVLLYRLLQKGYTNLLGSIAQEAAAEGCKKAALALQQAQAQHQQQLEMQKHRVHVNEVESEPSPVAKAEVDQTEDRLDLGFSFQGVFCRDLATVGNLLSQSGFNRPISVKFEALSC